MRSGSRSSVWCEARAPGPGCVVRPDAARPLTLDQLAAAQGLRPIASLDELVVDLRTDYELDAFLHSQNAVGRTGDPP